MMQISHSPFSCLVYKALIFSFVMRMVQLGIPMRQPFSHEHRLSNPCDRPIVQGIVSDFRIGRRKNKNALLRALSKAICLIPPLSDVLIPKTLLRAQVPCTALMHSPSLPDAKNGRSPVSLLLTPLPPLLPHCSAAAAEIKAMGILTFDHLVKSPLLAVK